MPFRRPRPRSDARHLPRRGLRLTAGVRAVSGTCTPTDDARPACSVRRQLASELLAIARRIADLAPEPLAIGVAIAHEDVDPPTAFVRESPFHLPDELGGQTLASLLVGDGDVVDPATASVPGAHRGAHDRLATHGDEERPWVAGLEHPQAG